MFGLAKSVMNRRLAMQLAAAAGGVMAVSAQGAIVNWASAVNGIASTAARWNPAVVPVAADDLVFNATAGSQAYSVTFDATTATSRTMIFNEDTVTLTMSATHTTTNGVAIGDVNLDVSTVSLTSGTWNSGPSGFVNIADGAGSTGTFNVSGSAAHFAVLGTSDLFVGNNGSGTLNIIGTGDVTCNDIMHVGQGSAATGNVTVSGFLAAPPFGVSSLIVNGAGESRWGNGGDATVSIANGARAQFAGDLSIANLSTSLTNVTVGGAGFLADATVAVAGDLSIARNTSAGVLPGTGTLNMNAESLLTVGGTLNLGNDPDGGGSGTLNINTGAIVEAANIVDGASGTINHTGGTLRVNGGTYTGHAVPLVVSGTGSPTLQYSGNTVNNLTAAGGVGLKVGDDLGAGTFTGNLIIDSGADVVMSGVSNDINIGDDTGTAGVVTVTGVGSRLVDNQPGDLIRVGFNGTGELRVEAGGQVLATEIQVPASSLNGHGTIFTEGASTITTANLSVGNAAGGAGSVTLNPPTVLNVTNAGIGMVVRNTGSVTVSESATVNAAGTILLDGGALRVHGDVHAGTLVDVDAGGLLNSGNGIAPLVDAPVRVRSGGAVEVISADLTIGKTTVANAVFFDPGSTLNIGSGRTLTIATSSSAGTIMGGAIDMQGGTFTTTPGSIAVMNGGVADQLTGFGTIDTNFEFNDVGTCTPTGTGLVFNGRTHLANSVDVAGSAIRLAPTATLEDALSGSGHVLNCKFTADAGSVMTNNNQTINPDNLQSFGPITIGDGTTTGVTLNGVLHMGTNGSITLSDLNGVGLGTLTDMNGGIITSVNGLSVGNGRVLRGRGSLNVNNPGGNGFTLVSGGTIDPDAYFSATDTYHGIAQFSIDGRYVQQANATYLCELAGFNNEFQPLNDKIVCGPAVLAGTLDVSLIDGYEPRLCDEFTIMQYTSRTGTWTNIVSPPGVGVGVRYEATRAVLFFNSLECNDIDFNNDGSIFDPQDIDAFLSVYSEGPCIPVEATCDDIDFNNDCSVFDPQDIDAFLSVFSEGPCIH